MSIRSGLGLLSMAEFTLIFIRQQRSWDETLKNAINILNKTREKSWTRE